MNFHNGRQIIADCPAELDLIATEMLAFPPNSSRNQNGSDLTMALQYLQSITTREHNS